MTNWTINFKSNKRMLGEQTNTECPKVKRYLLQLHITKNMYVLELISGVTLTFSIIFKGTGTL